VGPEIDFWNGFLVRNIPQHIAKFPQIFIDPIWLVIQGFKACRIREFQEGGPWLQSFALQFFEEDVVCPHQQALPCFEALWLGGSGFRKG